MTGLQIVLGDRNLHKYAEQRHTHTVSTSTYNDVATLTTKRVLDQF